MKYLFFLILIVANFACSKPPCITESNQDLLISWGEHDKINDIRRGFSLESDGRVYYFEVHSGEIKIKTKANKVNEENYCIVISNTETEIKVINRPSSPGIAARFVEFNIPSQKNIFQVLWNPLLANQNFNDCMNLYDDLMLLVPDDYEKKAFLIRTPLKEEFKSPEILEHGEDD